MDLQNTFIALGISLGLGLLVGLQREHVASAIAGIRSFALITLLGTFAALLIPATGPWLVAAGGLGVAGMLLAANLLRQRIPGQDIGVTTEVAGLVMYAVGVLLGAGDRVEGRIPIALATGGTVAIILHLKEPMHRFVARIGPTDLLAMMQFVLIALVIFPILPNHAYGPGPYHVLNPQEIWLVVVLIVGISLAGYVIYKMMGARAGGLVSGILGGVISSTATTVSYARQTKAPADASGRAASSRLAAQVIMIATAISLVRVIGEIAVVAPDAAGALAGPLGTLAGCWMIIAVALYLLPTGDREPILVHGNPAHLKAAVVFGLMYAGIKLAVAFGRDHFGAGGLYGIGAISGLVDMDAITLSTAGMVQNGKLDASTGWRVIVLAAMSNTLFKVGTVAALGSRRLLGRISVAFFAALAAGGLVLGFWRG